MPGLLIHGAALLLACHKEQSVLVVADAGNQRIVGWTTSASAWWAAFSVTDRSEPKEVE